MANGRKTGGRKAGTENKLSGMAKDNIAAVFNRLDGTNGMAEWAKENRSAFYTIYAKLLPLQLSGDEDNPLTIINKIERVIVDNTKA